MLGIVPSTVLSWLLGALLGGWFRLLPTPPTARAAVIGGGFIAGTIALGLNVIVVALFPSNSYEGPAFWWVLVGLPSLAFTAGGGWISLQLLRQLTSPGSPLMLPFRVPRWFFSDFLLIVIGLLIAAGSTVFAIEFFDPLNTAGPSPLVNLGVVGGLAIVAVYGVNLWQHQTPATR